MELLGIGTNPLWWERKELHGSSFLKPFWRFGELETELVFDKFKRLQQTTSVEAYYDEYERCRGQLLSKIPSLTTRVFFREFYWRSSTRHQRNDKVVGACVIGAGIEAC